jgi:hypothetical protein
LVDGNNLVSNLLFLHARLSRVGIVRLLNVIRDLSSSMKTVRMWPQGSRIFIAIIFDFFLLFVKQFVEIPETLEALLITEIARLNSKLNTSWALQCGRLSAFRVVAEFA